MNQTDKTRFAEMMATACAVYDKPPMEREALQAYWLMLEKFDVRLVLNACKDHMQNSKYFPKPSEIIFEIERRNLKPRATTYLPPPLMDNRRAVANRLMMSVLFVAGGVNSFALRTMTSLKNAIADEWPEGKVSKENLDDLADQLESLVENQDKVHHVNNR